MRWSEQETVKFVKLYLRHESLWNPYAPTYKSKNARTQAYRSLITELRAATNILLSEEELRMKIKNLRSTYTQELAKIRTRSGPDCTYRPTIRWFADWHKCYRRIKKSKYAEEPQVESEVEDDQEEASEKIWLSGDGVSNENEDVDADPFVSQTNDSYVYILKSEPSEEQGKIKSEATQNTYKAKRKKIKCRSPSTDHSDRTFRGSMDSGTETSNKEDEFDIYGKYIASQLRQMDLHKALRLQLEIQGLVSEARISELTSK